MDFYNLFKGIAHACTTNNKELLITWGDGLGDSLLLTAVTHEWNLRTGHKTAVYTQFPELYRGNPSVLAYPYLGNLILPFKSRIMRNIKFPIYAEWNPEKNSSLPPDKHIIAKMCEFVGMRGRVNLRPYLYLSENEVQNSNSYGREKILIQTSGLSARLSMRNKEWLPQRFQEVADKLRRDFRLIQVGSKKDPPLRNVTDFRGKTTPRQLACLMKGSRLFIGLVGFLMHLARASECPSVIIYGGREHPHQSGYICNENIASYLPCAPCWLWNECAYDRKCMSSIMVEDVLNASYRQLNHPRSQLEVATMII